MFSHNTFRSPLSEEDAATQSRPIELSASRHQDLSDGGGSDSSPIGKRKEGGKEQINNVECDILPYPMDSLPHKLVKKKQKKKGKKKKEKGKRKKEKGVVTH